MRSFRKSTDFGLALPPAHVIKRARLDAFAAEVRRTSGPTLVQWLTQMQPGDEPYRALVEGELSRRDALPLLHEDDLSCFDVASSGVDLDDEATRDVRFQDQQDPPSDWIPSGGLL